MEAQMNQWTYRWKTWIAPTKYTGVWRRKEGGHLIRGRVKDPRTGHLREIFRVVDEDAAEAHAQLQHEMQKIRDGVVEAAQRQIRFHEYAAQLFERKVATGEIRSAKGREKWASIVTVPLWEG
jgi:hypothetical protein